MTLGGCIHWQLRVHGPHSKGGSCHADHHQKGPKGREREIELKGIPKEMAKRIPVGGGLEFCSAGQTVRRYTLGFAAAEGSVLVDSWTA
jgi:hypothetical protein